MERYKTVILILFSCITVNVFAQTIIGSKIPATIIKTVDGSTFSSATFSNNGKPIVIDFWATWCIPCVKELNAIADKYEYWKKETGVKIIIVSVDTVHNTKTVSSFVRNKGWFYDVYLDQDAALQKAMQVMDTPCTFVIDGTGEVVWMHNEYQDGDEDKVFEELKKITAK